MAGDAQQDALVHGQGAGGEGEQGGQGAGVQVAVDAQGVLGLGQAGAEAQVLLQDRHPRVGQQAVEDGLDLARQVVQGAQGAGTQEEVEAYREDALLAALQGVA